MVRKCRSLFESEMALKLLGMEKTRLLHIKEIE